VAALEAALIPIVIFAKILVDLFGVICIPVMLVGQFVVPFVYTILLIFDGKLKYLMRFIALLSLFLSSNYGMGYVYQILKPVPRMRRGIDMTMLYVSMNGFLIVIALVVISVRATRKKDREDRDLERLRIVMDRHAINKGNG
jgi:hypothetical protein